MNCEKVNELLNELHDGAMSEALKTRMETHIADCSSCCAAFDRLQALRNLLQTDVAPAPSAALDRKLMQAFREKHHAPAKSPAWRRGIFAGSVSVPKPIFAAALIAVAVAVTTANLIGRNAAISSGVNTASTAPITQQALPEVIEKTKIVEVPVIKERVVTKTVYVEREDGNVQRAAGKSFELNSIRGGAVNKKRDDAANPAAVPNLQMSGSIAENGYFTRTDLSDFAPVAEAKIRIIKKEKTDEK